MFKKTLLAVGTLSVAGLVWAQSVGTLSNVSGTVTVNDGSKIVAGASGNSIPDGARVVTTSTGAATIRLANGCVVDLKPNQAITVLGSTSCRDLLASVQTTVPPSGPVAQGDTGVGDFFIVATGVGVTLAAIDGLRHRGRRLSGS